LPTYAVIDLGSYTAKLTIADVDKRVSIIKKEECSIGLGQGFQEDKLLNPKAINSAVDVISKWQDQVKQYNVVRVGIFATGVSQSARNRDQLVSSVLRETGLTLQILSEEDEARVLFRGVVGDFPKGFTFVVLNIGGSTTRLIIGEKNEIIQLYCIHKGTIELNKLLLSDPPTDDEITALRNTIDKSFRKISFRNTLKNPVLIHTGGELDYVLSTGCKVEKSTLSPTHPYRVMLSDFEMFAQRMQKLKKEELRSFKPDNPRWMDGAIASNTIAIHIARKFAFIEFIPSNRNITDGFLLTLQQTSMHPI